MRTKLTFVILTILTPVILSAQVNLDDKIFKRGHKIMCATFSPDSRYVATGGTDDKVIIWEANTSRIIHELDEKNLPLALKFSPDGKTLVSVGVYERINIWDVETGELKHSVKGHRDKILALDISPDGKTIASGSVDRLIKLWDLNTGTFIKDIKGHRGPVASVKFSADGTRLLTGSADHTIKEWNVANGFEMSSINKAHGGWVRSVCYSPDGMLIASSGDDRKIHLWQNGQLYNRMIAHKSYVNNISFSRDGQYILSSSYDRFFIVWEVKTGRMVYKPRAQRDKVFAAEFSPDGSKILTADYTHSLSLWDITPLGISDHAAPIHYANLEEEVNKPIERAKPIQKEEPKTQSITPVKKEVQLKETKPVVVPKTIDVDQIEPIGVQPDPNKYALIIGNEDYSSYQLGLKSESNVDFAVHDAEMFRKYSIHVLGVPEENIIFQANARAIEMHRAVNKINMISGITKGKADIFFYYAGHGFPDELTQEPYLIPVDVSGADLEFALNLNEVYKKLTEHPSKRVTVFLDACFSGGARNQGLVAARGVKIVPKENVFTGNMVVFSASSGDQSSLPYKDKTHGMFTYYLLKKLQETKGQVTYRELSDYLREQVGVKSVLVNHKEQTPQTNISMDIQNEWGDLRIR